MRVKDKQLIPVAFDLATGKNYDLDTLVSITKKKLKLMRLDTVVYDVCLHILDESAAGNSSFTKIKGSNSSPLTEQEYNIIMKDFGEISGAAFVLKTNSNYKSVKFPTGNERLVDYYINTKDKLEVKFSAKANAGSKPSIVSLIPMIEDMMKALKSSDKAYKAAKALYILGHEQSNALYLGPLQAASYLNLPGYTELIALLKNKKLDTGYTAGIPTQKHLETAVENAGGYENFRALTKKFYDASGYSQTLSVDKTKQILAKGYAKKRYGLLHYPITSEIIKWLNTDKNKANEILNKAANTLTISQIYLKTKRNSLYYDIKLFSDATFEFQSPSSTPYPTNNRVGFIMKPGKLKKA
jgi:hypothetical protein